MAESMAAVVNHRPGDYRLEEVPRPHAGAGEVVTQVEAARVCGSDAKPSRRRDVLGPAAMGQGARHTRPRFLRHLGRGRGGRGRGPRGGAGRPGRSRADLPVRGLPLLPPGATSAGSTTSAPTVGPRRPASCWASTGAVFPSGWSPRGGGRAPARPRRRTDRGTRRHARVRGRVDAAAATLSAGVLGAGRPRPGLFPAGSCNTWPGAAPTTRGPTRGWTKRRRRYRRAATACSFTASKRWPVGPPDSGTCAAPDKKILRHLYWARSSARRSRRAGGSGGPLVPSAHQRHGVHRPPDAWPA
jgi:hypothetical protein